jgi:uncharacterized membrane protein
MNDQDARRPEDHGGAAPAAKNPPIFEALLYPRRSLDRRGYLILIAGTAIVISLYGLVFLIIGAWPIFGFLGGEWVLFWLLFSRHHRGNGRAERIRLYADYLLFESFDGRGRGSSIRLQPYWLNVILERAGEPDNALFLRSHGKQVEVGSFLSPRERGDLASELRDVLARHRSPDLS